MQRVGHVDNAVLNLEMQSPGTVSTRAIPSSLLSTRDSLQAPKAIDDGFDFIPFEWPFEGSFDLRRVFGKLGHEQ